MERYIIIDDKGAGADKAILDVNAALWDLTRPLGDDDTTQYWHNMVAHPTNGQWALGFVGTETLRIEGNETIDISKMINLLASEAKGQQKSAANNYITSKKGSRIVFDDLLNELGDGVTIKTRAEMEADGWFPDVDI